MTSSTKEYLNELSCHGWAFVGILLSFLSVFVALQLNSNWLEQFEYAAVIAVGLSAFGLGFTSLGYESKARRADLKTDSGSDMFGFFVYSLAILCAVATALLLMFHYRETVSLGLDTDGWSASADSTAAIFGVAVAFAGSLVAIRIASHGRKSSNQFQRVQNIKSIQDQLDSSLRLANQFETQFLEFQNECQALIDLFFTANMWSSEKKWFFAHNTLKVIQRGPESIDVEDEVYNINHLSVVRELHTSIIDSVLALSKTVSTMSKDSQLVKSMCRKLYGYDNESRPIYFPESLIKHFSKGDQKGVSDEEIIAIKDKLSDIASSMAQRGWRMKTANHSGLTEIGADGVVPVVKYLAELKSYSTSGTSNDEHLKYLSVLLMGFYCATEALTLKDKSKGVNSYKTLRDFTHIPSSTDQKSSPEEVFKKLNHAYGHKSPQSFNSGVFYLACLLHLQPGKKFIKEEFEATIANSLELRADSDPSYERIIEDYANRSGEYSQSFVRARDTSESALTEFVEGFNLCSSNNVDECHQRYTLLFSFDDRENSSSNNRESEPGDRKRSTIQKADSEDTTEGHDGFNSNSNSDSNNRNSSKNS